MAVARRLELLCDESPHGAVDFATYMEVVLYDEDDGYYTGSADRAGVRGDFVTSPELGDAFARCVWDWLDRLGAKRVADAGGGRGTLATQIRAVAADAGRSVETAVVDVSAAARREASAAGHVVAATVRDLAWVPDVIVANELLDNLPVRLLSSPETERRVGRRDGLFTWVDCPAPGPLAKTVESIGTAVWRSSPHGVVPVPVGAWAWLDALPREVRLLLVDYGADVVELLERDESPVRAYRGHTRVDPLVEPGAADVTCEVAVDLVTRHAATTGLLFELGTQAAWLAAHGLDILGREARAAREDAIRSRDTMGELRARHRINELQALVDGNGLGGFCVLAGSRS